MNLFKTLLLAPAALGLLSPLAASAAPSIALDKYSSADEQVTSISQFSDVKPTDWAYQALSNLIEKYGCVAGYPNGTYGGGKAMTRYEAAALLNACLDRVTEVTDELKKLMKEFEKELAVLKGRVDGLEARVGVLEANQFSTTTKLKGIATFVLGGNSFGGNSSVFVDIAQTNYGATTFNYDVRLNFDTSFTGKDLLRTTLRAGNFGQSSFAPGNLNSLEVGFEEDCGIIGTQPKVGIDCGDVVAINRLFYQFPIGSGFTATVGARVRQDDMLAMWPSVYPGDSVLDIFTYAGAPAAYSLNLGAGAGLTYTNANGFNASVNYVSANGGKGSPSAYGTPLTTGGIMTQASAETFTAQAGYAAKNWGAAVAYTFGQNVGFSGTPSAGQGLFVTNNVTATNSIGLSAYWQPQTSGWVPSISTGWGYTGYTITGATQTQAAQSWYVGLQWADAFIKGNTFGMAVGQPTFLTTTTISGTYPNDAGYAWEWWYKFQVTDHISVTPAIFYLSNFLGQSALPSPDGPLNNFGALVKTTFKF
ncbi:MAG: iron uptake porin [Cyanobacteriota bacterium]